MLKYNIKNFSAWLYFDVGFKAKHKQIKTPSKLFNRNTLHFSRLSKELKDKIVMKIYQVFKYKIKHPNNN